MKLFIQIFKDGNFGNFRFDVIVIPSNQITVLELKQILYEKYAIKKENQRLSVKMCNKKFVIMTNEYPLNYFFIRERTIIYFEFIHPQTKTEEFTKKIICKDIKSKYLSHILCLN